MLHTALRLGSNFGLRHCGEVLCAYSALESGLRRRPSLQHAVCRSCKVLARHPTRFSAGGTVSASASTSTAGDSTSRNLRVSLRRHAELALKLCLRRGLLLRALLLRAFPNPGMFCGIRTATSRESAITPVHTVCDLSLGLYRSKVCRMGPPTSLALCNACDVGVVPSFHDSPSSEHTTAETALLCFTGWREQQLGAAAWIRRRYRRHHALPQTGTSTASRLMRNA